MRKRMVNEELADVWGTMIDEKIEVLRQKAESCSEDKQKILITISTEWLLLWHCLIVWKRADS